MDYQDKKAKRVYDEEKARAWIKKENAQAALSMCVAKRILGTDDAINLEDLE
jgi:hypothetical protein